MSALSFADLGLTPEELFRMIPPAQRRALIREQARQDMRDRSYQLTPIGADTATYLTFKRKRLTKASAADWEVALAFLAKHFAHLELSDLEPPAGRESLEEFMDWQWGKLSGSTYNKNLSIIKDFFRWAVGSGRLNGDPAHLIEPARRAQVERTTFGEEQCAALLAASPGLRDRIALRLLLYYGVRKGALQAVQFKHFDHQRRKLTIFTKGAKVRRLPLPEPALWLDLERHILDVEAQPDHFLMCPRKLIPRVGVRTFPQRPLSGSALHRWWYERLAAAGIVPQGTNAGERMHKARHTAGQRVLDRTGNLKVAQKLLGHASIQTTADVYLDWDDEALALTLQAMLTEEDE